MSVHNPGRTCLVRTIATLWRLLYFAVAHIRGQGVQQTTLRKGRMAEEE